MPSLLHESLLLLFRNCPELVPKLLRDKSCGSLPHYTDVTIESTDLSQVQPTEYRADLVVSLSDGAPVLCVIVEVQLSIDDDKRFSWPAYVTTLRARWHCPVCLLVVCADAGVARWAEQPIPIGCTNVFIPRVLGPSDVPEITDEVGAEFAPELTVLSAVVHGHDLDAAKAARIAAIAQGVSAKLDADRSRLYVDLVLNSLSEAALTVLQQNMHPCEYESQSELARGYYLARGRVEMVSRLLKARFGPLSDKVHAQLACSSAEELHTIVDQALTASSLEEALTARS